MGYLQSLEIENFKSYKGKHFIGPFKKFSSIIGPNGSGKSNLMDAVCFVLGEKTQNLRVRKLGDLIHGAPIGKPVGTRCNVKMTFVNDDESEKTFTRTVTSGGSEYRVDGNVVTPAQYHEHLEEINIFIKAKNFLVYQGAVEQIAMKSPKERTQLFEELSKSGDLVNEYNKLKQELEKAKEDAQFNMNKRRGVAAEKREARIEKDEAERYQAMRDTLAEKQIQLFLVQLFYAEQGRDKAKNDLQKMRDEIQNVRSEKSEKEGIVSSHQQELRRATKEMRKLENECDKKEKNITDFKPKFNESKQQLVHIKQKIETAEKVHVATVKLAKEQEQNLKELEKQRKDVQKQRKKCEEKLQGETQKHSLHLENDQILEYNQLKANVEAQSARLTANIEDIKQDKEAKIVGIQTYQHQIKTLEDRIKQKEGELERQEQTLSNIDENRERQIQQLEEEKKNVKELEKEVIESKKLLEEYTVKLQKLNDEISDAHGDSLENENSRRRNEAVENLKRLYPDKVHGRLVEICSPSQRKYQIAITKVLGGNMNAIVVDTDDTAEECIAYLKEQRYFSEKFLPLNSLEVSPINETLREVTDIRGVKLLYDVINCTQPNIRKIIQFATNNSVVCETAEDARKMAFGRDNHRYKAVSLDGTLFQQSGVISGGGSELKHRAKKWDEQGMKKLRDERKDLQEKCNALHRNRKRELDVEMKRSQLQQLENRIRYTKTERDRLQNDIIPRLHHDIDALKCELQLIQPKINDGQNEVQKLEKKISEVEKEKETISDRIFADFCRRVGIHDIREYENREMRFFQERQRELKAFDTEIARLQYEIDFLKSEDRRKKEQEEAAKITKLQESKKEYEKKIDEQSKMLKKYEEDLKDTQNKTEDQRSKVFELEENVTEAKKEVSAIDRNLHSMEKKARSLEQLELRKAQKRHSLLHECKIAGIEIPLSSGNLQDVMIEEEPDDTENGNGNGESVTAFSQQSLQQADRIVIDYETLEANPRKFKDENEVNKLIEKYTKAVSEAQGNLAKIAAPNLKANERMEQVRSKEDETREEYENACKKARKAQQAFERVKNERYRLFTDFFEPVSQRIDEIYKQLSRNESAQAFLGAENQEEPYLDGISYNCVAPGKRFRPMDNLSGGEKTIAALALLFAIHSRNPSPFFVLDEIDAALDNTNIGKVVSYIAERSQRDMQLIVISLKEEFYNKADALVGIYPKPANITTSGVLIFDLINFKANMLDSTAVAD
uniref:Structural maintenance of chromosomes protein n=1 Tax=Panagrolaimus sp. PS1159 TaxID=55785 RepID=A0AC35FVK5_9BILA